MKKILFAFPVAAAAMLLLQFSGDPLPLGSPIPSPETKMKDISGTEVSLKDAQTKKGLLVMFSCNTCPYESSSLLLASLEFNITTPIPFPCAYLQTS